MAPSWRREDFSWLSGGSPFLWEWWGAGIAAQRGCGCPIHPWKSSRPGWMGPWAAWAGIRYGGWWPCLHRRIGASWSLRSLPTQAILLFYERQPSFLSLDPINRKLVRRKHHNFTMGPASCNMESWIMCGMQHWAEHPQVMSRPISLMRAQYSEGSQCLG